jgi:hypothetical protein
MKTIQIKEKKIDTFSHTHKQIFFKQFEIFFLLLRFFSSQTQQNKTIDKIFFSCAKYYQTFGLKEKQENKTKNKSAALFSSVYMQKKRK